MKRNLLATTLHKPSGFSILLCVLGTSVAQSELRGEAPSQPNLVTVAIYDHSNDISNGRKNLSRVLDLESGFSCSKITPAEIRANGLDDFDVLVMPGGSGSKQSEKLGDVGRDKVREFVRKGGGYVGVCAGSYLASSHYSWSLGIINARVWDRVHWARGQGDVKLSLSAAGCQLLGCVGPEVDVFYGQGPLLVPGGDSTLPGYEVLGTYKTEIAEKGAPQHAMVGTHAIIRSKYGEGRVICFSPHPEEPGGPKVLIQHGVRWASTK
ncbi:BPL-N domain-containing protein [Blastopirellula retiformator]|uniref:Biotin-protein ligase N-terminal domain-containing protein n=1 Tax=Blastopirellula retiformator TaxID=2527970 RepID=A0A5C5V805_9BACT|nr:BPL-N domain-containing protein [Blastopirellula retiformator]TWT34421.1 hypothetical protein Enr8_18290 [Blastopirellula retiformator]